MLNSKINSAIASPQILRYVVYDRDSGGVLVNIAYCGTRKGRMARIYLKHACCGKSVSVDYVVGNPDEATIKSVLREHERPIDISQFGKSQLTTLGKFLSSSAETIKIAKGKWCYISDDFSIAHAMTILQDAVWQNEEYARKTRDHHEADGETIH